jgi:hypothetical protein
MPVKAALAIRNLDVHLLPLEVGRTTMPPMMNDLQCAGRYGNNTPERQRDE